MCSTYYETRRLDLLQNAAPLLYNAHARYYRMLQSLLQNAAEQALFKWNLSVYNNRNGAYHRSQACNIRFLSYGFLVSKRARRSIFRLIYLLDKQSNHSCVKTDVTKFLNLSGLTDKDPYKVPEELLITYTSVLTLQVIWRQQTLVKA